MAYRFVPTSTAIAIAFAFWSSTSAAGTVVTAYGGQGVNHDLVEIPGSLLSLDTEGSYLNGLAMAQEYGQGFGGTWYVEAFLGDHRGLQRLTEASVSGGLLFRPFPVRANWLELRGGVGLSHAFGTPVYEDGPLDDPRRRYRTQLGLVMDVTARPERWSGLGLGIRVHHRSGAYGLIAPRRVGSNFVGVTISRRI